jgi:oxygen-independent coproporphyrinogen-3 oxidase
MIQTGKQHEVAQEHFYDFSWNLESKGFIHYELSNFGRLFLILLIGWEKIYYLRHIVRMVFSKEYCNNLVFKAIDDKLLNEIETLSEADR